MIKTNANEKISTIKIRKVDRHLNCDIDISWIEQVIKVIMFLLQSKQNVLQKCINGQLLGPFIDLDQHGQWMVSVIGQKVKKDLRFVDFFFFCFS